MTGLAETTIFDSFNARNLDPNQVAKTFVPSSQYAELTKRAHTVIIGPRGSGKTTLLKMLQSPALEAWQHEQADKFRGSIDYTGVFIATDVSWGAQIRSLGYGKLEEEEAQLLGIAAFTTHVIRSFVIAMEHRAKPDMTGVTTHRRATLDVEQEANIVRELAAAWYVQPRIFSFSALRFALSRRLSEIREVGNLLTTMSRDEQKAHLQTLPFLYMHFLQSTALAVELFNSAANEHSAKWALMFDELELAPRWIMEELMQSLRSVDDRFLFKLSMSPYTTEVYQLQNAFAAMPGHDFDTIPLWYAHKDDGYAFCQSLLEAMLSENRIVVDRPLDIFGPSEFDTRYESSGEQGADYNVGARLQVRFTSLARKDVSFQKYLESRNINLNDLRSISGTERASDVRKVSALVTVRDEFRGNGNAAPGGKGQLIRSRKNPKTYAGASSLFAVVEGNPRWFIGVVGRLLKTAKDEAPVPRWRQGGEIMNAANRFRALLRTIPSSTMTDSSDRGLLTLLDRIGEYIFQAVVLADFSPDAPGSFTIDSHSSPQLLEALAQALNAGAIVYVPDNSSDLLLTSLKGKRFRLAYLLAPYYRIPIRLGPSRSLQNILRGDREAENNQENLFTVKQ